MSKHTYRAVRAAKRLEEVYLLSYTLAEKRSQETGQPMSFAIREKAEQDILKCIAHIIDHETGLPELKARINSLEAEEPCSIESRNKWLEAYVDNLCKTSEQNRKKNIVLEAEKEELVEALEKIANFAGEDDVVTINTIVGVAQAALAKAEPTNPKAEPESGEKEEPK